MDNISGIRFKKLLKERGYTQTGLAQKTGISRQYISCLYRGEQHNISYEKLSKLAAALYISTEQLLAVLNDIDKPPDIRPSFEEQLELIKLSAPAFIPVYDSVYFHAGRGSHMNPLDSIPLQREFVANKNLEAYRIRGSCLSPVIMENDVIIVDPDAHIDIGHYIACQYDDRFIVGKFKKIADDSVVENGHGHVNAFDCVRIARIVKIIRDI